VVVLAAADEFEREGVGEGVASSLTLAARDSARCSCRALLEGGGLFPEGLFGLLEEECRLPDGSDKALLEKIFASANGVSKERCSGGGGARRTGGAGARALIAHDGAAPSPAVHRAPPPGARARAPRAFIRRTRGAPLGFALRHYAGEVRYDAAGFLSSNKERCPEDLSVLLRRSSREMVRDMFTTSGSEQARTATRRAARFRGVASTFRAEMAQLVAELEQSHLSFVRCIKPNAQLSPRCFDEKSVRNQLR